MIKNCKKCSAEYEVTQDDLDFYDKVSPVFNWKKYQIPIPTFCPDCRSQRRLSFRNERKLYKRKCDFTWKNIISMFSPEKDCKIYEQREWWSDKWNWLDYWKEFKFDKSAFGQFNKLCNSTPYISLLSASSENCEYTHLADNNKNCYLVFMSWENEDVSYWYWLNDCKNSFDISCSSLCEGCYFVDNCQNCNKVFYSINSENCRNSYFLDNCIWCSDCFLCNNLRHKKYCFNNEQLTEAEYGNKLKQVELWNYSNIQNLFKKFLDESMKSIKKFNISKNSEACSWDYLFNSKNCNNCFIVSDCEDCKYMEWVLKAKNSYDVSAFWKPWELLYEVNNVGLNSFNVKFSSFCYWLSDSFYCNFCFYSKNLFLCSWLKHKQYCILNKQYSKEEYEILVPRIIEHMKSTWEWWEFLPTKLSPFAYNETVSQEYFPLSKEEVLSKGWRWKDDDDYVQNVSKIIPAEKLPNNINDIPDDVLNWAIKCEVTWRPFMLIPQELKFYRENSIPIPHLHPDERHEARMKLRNPRKLYDRQCMKCSKDIQTTYSPDRQEIVYCEKCYLKEVY